MLFNPITPVRDTLFIPQLSEFIEFSTSRSTLPSTQNTELIKSYAQHSSPLSSSPDYSMGNCLRCLIHGFDVLEQFPRRATRMDEGNKVGVIQAAADSFIGF